MTRSNGERWIWLDLEMSGLNPDSDQILEIATVVTDCHLEVVSEGPELAIHQPESVLRGMDEWCTKTHGESGLTDRVRNSRCSLQQAEQQTLTFLSTHIPPGTAPLCGNSVWQDKRFLYRYMPELAQFFHYRQLDVSSLKILAANWAPELIDDFNKQSRHRARDDIYDSIAELRLYRQVLMVPAARKNRPNKNRRPIR